ncbi:hypothetical protein Tfer_1416 [Thermincola ferriacetica]|uniref:HD domain-containing protein n=1 Tax=Thermincola ferriacetica TaxID=281456 RepID=A0A0L6W2V8_9FIRM|nr:HD domain-containing protein [Thermincola ferriacetica]KNZ69806.1 hypothetical protein Tfer_1416 [Thermincola ferriacetica]
MSWSLKYIKKLQREIEKYKEQMLYVFNSEEDIAKQSYLLRLSQDLDKLMIRYQSFKKLLTSFQNMPYSVDFYMNTKFCEVRLDGDCRVLNIDKVENNLLYIIKDNFNNIVDVLYGIELNGRQPNKKANNFSFCDSGISIWLANKIFHKEKSEFLLVQNRDCRIIGILEKKQTQLLCRQKAMSASVRKKLCRIEEAFEHVPASIFVLDQELYIDYANSAAIKNFSEVLPVNYLHRRADLVFSGFFSNSYKEFINSKFWQYIKSGQECSEIEVKLLNYISLSAGIKVIKTGFDIECIVVSFVNSDDNSDELKQTVEALKSTTDELSQALSLFIPREIESKLRQIPEYKDIYNPETKKITVIAKIDEGGYWHVVNCLRILCQIDRLGVLKRFNIDKQLLIQAILIHDIGKIQPVLRIGDTVDPMAVFEKSSLHALRSSEFSAQMGYSKYVTLLVKYHHHREDELPPNFPRELIPAFKLFKIIDGLSAAITRRNATVTMELSNTKLIIYEENFERPEYNKKHILNFTDMINPEISIC